MSRAHRKQYLVFELRVTLNFGSHRFCSNCRARFSTQVLRGMRVSTVKPRVMIVLQSHCQCNAFRHGIEAHGAVGGWPTPAGGVGGRRQQLQGQLHHVTEMVHGVLEHAPGHHNSQSRHIDDGALTCATGQATVQLCRSRLRKQANGWKLSEQLVASSILRSLKASHTEMTLEVEAIVAWWLGTRH